MAKKSSVKQAASPRGLSGTVIAGIAVAVVAIGALVFWPSSTSTSSNAESAAGAAEPSAAIVANAERKAALGPHKQASYPPIPFQGYAPPRSPEVVTAAYQFAAEHPEITSYVPCFCGCENAGHEGNTDCFVKQRDANGDVIAWEEHGLDCAVCIDVATVARQMYSSGASVRDIRAAVDKQFGPLYPGKMPTPQPPAPHQGH
ncbi:MAG: PCYCGC motif-containing (lipo)protein [Vicinamibacterales bacterium]